MHWDRRIQGSNVDLRWSGASWLNRRLHRTRQIFNWFDSQAKPRKHLLWCRERGNECHVGRDVWTAYGPRTRGWRSCVSIFNLVFKGYAIQVALGTICYYPSPGDCPVRRSPRLYPLYVVISHPSRAWAHAKTPLIFPPIRYVPNA